MIAALCLLVFPHATTASGPNSTEIAYDDGSPDLQMALEQDDMILVQFSPPYAPAPITAVRFLISGAAGLADFRVHVLDISRQALGASALVTPESTGWVSVDLSPLGIVVDEDFYVGIEWETTDEPALGLDSSSPDSRSWVVVEDVWLRMQQVLGIDQDAMIRVTIGDLVVVDEYIVSDCRADVGSTQTIHLHAIWASDGSPLESGDVYVNGTAFVLNSTGWAEIPTNRDDPGRQTLVVTGVDASGVDVYRSEESDPYVVFDRIDVTLTAPNGTVDVGQSATIASYAKYAYDGESFSGEIVLNDTTTKDIPGSFDYTVDHAVDDLFGITQFSANTVTVVFDLFEAEVTDVNVPEEVDVQDVLIVNVAVGYSFGDETQLEIRIWDRDTQSYVQSEDHILSGNGTIDSLLEMQPTEQKEWNLRVEAWYFADSEWTHDSEGWFREFAVTVIPEFSAATLAIAVAIGMLALVALRKRLLGEVFPRATPLAESGLHQRGCRLVTTERPRILDLPEIAG
jgi:hypothetical protein